MIDYSMSYQRLVANGDYLGFDKDKGYLYSIFVGYNKEGYPVQGIYSVKGHVLELLITYRILTDEEEEEL